MRNRNPQLWLIRFKDLSKGKPRKIQQLTSPPCKYKWEALHWLKQQKPLAEIESIEPFRTMSITK